MTLINIQQNYREKIAELKEALNAKNIHQLPQIRKVTVNSGLGPHRQNKEMIKYIAESLTKITGQKPVMTKAKKSISSFKLREGEPVGFKVTLRHQRMEDFLNRLINVTLPRIREFRGVDQRQFDAKGNLTLGFRDQSPFAELGSESFERPFGLSLTMTIDNSDPERSYDLLSRLGFPVKIR